MKDKGVYLFIPIFLCAFVFIAFTYINSNQNTPETTIQPTPVFPDNTAKDWTADEAKQIGRKEIIQKCINRGIFQNVDYLKDVAIITVGSNFYLLSFKEKSTFVQVVYAYVATQNHDDEFSGVELEDYFTGKKVGTYTSIGLEME